MCWTDPQCLVKRHRVPGAPHRYSRKVRWGERVISAVLLLAAVAFLANPGGQRLIMTGATRGMDEATRLASRVLDQGSSEVPGGDRCTVAAVVDGDTLRCRDGRRVRLVGVDTPELAHDGRPRECWARTGRAELRRLVEGQPVTLAGDPLQGGKDGYGRVLAYVASPRTRDAGAVLLRSGAAEVYGGSFERRPEYAALQGQAKRADRGRWGVCDADRADAAGSRG